MRGDEQRAVRRVHAQAVYVGRPFRSRRRRRWVRGATRREQGAAAKRRATRCMMRTLATTYDV